MRSVVTVILATIVCGCASNPGIVELSPNTYMLSREDKGGIFGNPAALKASVIKDADAFARSKGMIAIPITTHETPMGILGHFASFDYQFRLVPPGDPDAKSTPLIQRPDVVVQETERKTVSVQATTAPPPPDVYTELLKLDDLRKKGIITEDEFQIQKTRLLTGK